MSNINNSSNSYRYRLASNKVAKTDCFYCGAKKHWQRYLDTETGELLPEQHGKCDNEQKCGAWITPKDTGYARMIWQQEQKVTGVTKVTAPTQERFRTLPIPKPKTENIFFDFETFKQTLDPERYEKNMFIQNLFYRMKFPFEVDEVLKVIQLYKLGTVANGYRAGATTFPFIDIKGNVRAIQVKKFDDANHTIATDFLHSIISKYYNKRNEPIPKWLKMYNDNELKVSCLFGEHLLSKYPLNPIALVEAPKTAIYGMLYFGIPEEPDDLIWLAVYNISSFKMDKLKVLKGRNVIIFPDLSKDGQTFSEWKRKAGEIEAKLSGTHLIFSDLLERIAPESDKKEGKDLADYLIKLDWREFRKGKGLKENNPSFK